MGCFEKAIELNSKSKEAWSSKGRTLSVLGPTCTAEALSSYDKAIEIDSKWAQPYFDKGQLLLKTGRSKEALESFDAGLKFNDKSACAWCNRGVALNRLKQNEEALQSCNRALELGPSKKCKQILLDMVIVLYHLGRYEEGADFARRVLEADPENAENLSALACCLQRLGKDKEALEIFEKALKLKKDDKEINWDDLAELYERLGRGKEAEEARQKFDSIKESNTDDNKN